MIREKDDDEDAHLEKIREVEFSHEWSWGRRQEQ